MNYELGRHINDTPTPKRIFLVRKNQLPWQRPSAPLGSYLTHRSNSLDTSKPTTRPKRHLDWVSCFAQLTAECPYLTMGRPFPSLKILPSHGEIWTSHLIHGSVGPPESTRPQPKRHLDRFSRLQGSCDRQTQQLKTDRPTDRLHVLLGR